MGGTWVKLSLISQSVLQSYIEDEIVVVWCLKIGQAFFRIINVDKWLLRCRPSHPSLGWEQLYVVVDKNRSMFLCSSDVAVPHPDKKSIILYVTSLFRVLPQVVSMEAIQEVETLPRGATSAATRTTMEEHYQIQTQQRFSQQVKMLRQRHKNVESQRRKQEAD